MQQKQQKQHLFLRERDWLYIIIINESIFGDIIYKKQTSSLVFACCFCCFCCTLLTCRNTCNKSNKSNTCFWEKQRCIYIYYSWISVIIDIIYKTWCLSLFRLLLLLLSLLLLTSSRLLTLGIAQTRLALRSLNRSLAFTSRCHIDGKSTLLPSEAACDRWVSHQNGTTALGSPWATAGKSCGSPQRHRLIRICTRSSWYLFFYVTKVRNKS